MRENERGANFNGNKVLFYLQILFNLLLIVNVELTKLLGEVAFKREFRREMSVNKHCFGAMSLLIVLRYDAYLGTPSIPTL